MRQVSSSILRAAHGFTLVEAMIAVAVLVLGVMVLEKNFVAQIMGNNSAKLTTAAVAATSSFMERLRTLPLNNAQLPNAANGGAMQAGLLNNGANCANLNAMNATIDAAGDVVADYAVNWDEGREQNFFIFPRGQALQPRGLFTIFWNVCDHPDANDARRIRMIIRWRDNNRADNVNDGRNNQQVVMDYVRGDL